MGIFTVAECDQIIERLKCQLLEDPSGSIGSFSIAGRTIQYRSAEDLESLINLWTRQRSNAVKAASGAGRSNPSVACFR